MKPQSIKLDSAVVQFITQHDLCNKDDPILVAVSGGVDSMVLAHILASKGFNIGIAHCNFQLRKKASDKDEAFVQTYAQLWKVPFYSTKFNTREHVKKNKLNLQEAARNLRYTWFSQIMEKHGYSHLVTAHHIDDQIETVMLNIARGAGIFGLQGMPPKRNHIIRPLLFASKDEILAYAEAKLILYREDQSNLNKKYRRNYIRHDLIPNVEKRLPSFKNRMAENIQIWQKSARLLGGFIDQQIVAHKKLKDDTIILEVDKIEESLRDLVTFEWVRDYGFNFSQVKQMLRCVDENLSGRDFYSRFNRLIVDRKKLILSGLTILDESNSINLSGPDDIIHLPQGKIEIKLLSSPPEDWDIDPNVAFLDAQKMQFPLQLRKWKPGDYFYPLGMNLKKQKLKKYFVNKKLNPLDKEKIWLLCHEGDICWIVGQRMDDRYKITPDTKYVLRINWVKES